MVTATGGGVIEDVRDGVLRLTLSNPEQRNALTPDMLRTLAAAVGRAGADSRIRVVVLRGEGSVFSSGYALTSFPEGKDLHEDDELTAAGEALARCPAPTVAVLNGDAIGAAFDLALASDFRIARRGAQVGITAAKFGIVYPWQGIQRMVDALGLTLARRFLITAELVRADQAFAWGAVDTVAASDAELEEAEQWWTDALLRAAPLSVAGTKRILRMLVGGGVPSEAQRREVLQLRRQAIDSADAREAALAFRERRVPEFSGK